MFRILTTHKICEKAEMGVLGLICEFFLEGDLRNCVCSDAEIRIGILSGKLKFDLIAAPANLWRRRCFSMPRFIAGAERNGVVGFARIPQVLVC